MKLRLMSIGVIVFCCFLLSGANGEPVNLFTFSHYSPALQKEQPVNVLMPTDSEPGKNYPVLYLLHGAWGNYSDWIERTDLEDLAKGDDLIIVMPDGGQFGWYVDSPLEATSAYETYITKELISFVDQVLPTIRRREARGICGLSMGGHGALSLAAKHPELFSSASSLSGILRLENHPDSWHLTERLGPYETSREIWLSHSVYDLAHCFLGTDVEIYYDVGDNDSTKATADNRQCHERMAELGVPHHFQEFPGGHTWEYWGTHIREHLEFHAHNFSSRLGRLLSKTQKEQRAGLSEWHQRYYQRLELFRAENAQLKENYPDRKTVVLLGSSSVEGFFRQGDLLPGWFLLNRGISGDKIGLGETGILTHLNESVLDCNPAHVFILNGRNDLGDTLRTGSPEVSEVVECYRKVVQKILDEIPDVRIHIVSCPPTRGKYEKMAPLVYEYDKGLKKIAGDLDVDYIDIYSKLVGKNRLLKPEYSADGLHVSAKAYRIWAEEMRKALCSKPK